MDARSDQIGLRCVAALEAAQRTERSRGTIGVRSQETSASTSFVIWIQSQYERSIENAPVVYGTNASGALHTRTTSVRFAYERQWQGSRIPGNFSMLGVRVSEIDYLLLMKCKFIHANQ